MIKSQNITTKLFFENAKKDVKIPNERLETLNNIAIRIASELKDRNKVNLNFISTNNSRRSQIAQVWAFYASEYFQLKKIFSFSGGTEVSAFHRNTIKTLQKSGFEFNIIDFSHQNPKYLISFKETKKNILGFSKKFDNEENSFPYLAITTCDRADENCHFIPDAVERFHLSYIDIETLDSMQNKIYTEINKQIAAETFTIFEKIISINDH